MLYRGAICSHSSFIALSVESKDDDGDGDDDDDGGEDSEEEEVESVISHTKVLLEANFNEI